MPSLTDPLTTTELETLSKLSDLTPGPAITLDKGVFHRLVVTAMLSDVELVAKLQRATDALNAYERSATYAEPFAPSPATLTMLIKESQSAALERDTVVYIPPPPADEKPKAEPDLTGYTIKNK